MQVKRNKITTRISYGVLLVIAINYLTRIANDMIKKENNPSIDAMTDRYMPAFLLAIDCIVLLVGLVWICKKLRVDLQFKGNTKWMTIHSILLLLTLVSFIIAN
jgi:hypothetical protein